MGEENKQKVCSMGNIDLSEYYLADEAAEKNKFCGLNGVSISCEIKLLKELRCKTKKRFIKLLMSEGISKYSAEEIAKEKPKNTSYSSMWLWYTLCTNRRRTN